MKITIVRSSEGTGASSPKSHGSEKGKICAHSRSRNRDITPDALGPEVVRNLDINRHIVKEYGAAAVGEEVCI